MKAWDSGQLRICAGCEYGRITGQAHQFLPLQTVFSYTGAMDSSTEDPGSRSLRFPAAEGWVSGATVLLALVLNFDRLLLQLGTHLPGLTANDAAFSIWHVWWAQFGLRQSDGLVISAWAGAPFLSNHLTYVPILQGQIYRLLAGLFNPILAFNLVLIAAYVATHLALYAFLRSRSGSPLLAALASTAFILSPWYANALYRADLITVGLWPLPLALLAWDRWLAEPNAWRAALLVLVLEAAILSGMLHLAWIAAVFVPYALWTGLPERARLASNDAARDQLSMMVLVYLILLLVYPGPAAVRSLLGNEPPFGPALAQAPGELTSFVGPIRESGPLIWLAGIASLFFMRESRRHSLWLVCAGLFLLYGVHLLPEPWRMFSGALALPYQAFCADEVFMGLALVAVVAFLARHWGQSWQNLTGWRPWAAGGLLLAAIVLSGPATRTALPTQTLGPSPAYAEIAAEPEDYLVLVYPFGLQSHGDSRELGEGADLSQYAVWHQKRTLSGLSPYYDPALIERFAEMPFLSVDDATPVRAASAALTEAVNTWRIGYVLVHTDRLAAEEARAIEGLLAESGALCTPVQYDALTVYRARWHPEGCP